MEPIGDRTLPKRQPLVRVWLLGPFQVECRDSEGRWRPIPSEAWGQGTGSRRLLKRLLCAPNRRLRRGTLLEDLWPEAADRNLTDAAHRLRRTFREEIPNYQGSLLHSLNHPPCYELASQDVIWCDSDAVQQLLQEADQHRHDAAERLPLLEEAMRYLERGEFLEDEEGHWCKSLRQEYKGIRRLCRLWLADTYVMQGRIWLARKVLAQAVRQDPTDEDALQRLMQLYHQQGLRATARQVFLTAQRRAKAAGTPLSTTLEEAASQSGHSQRLQPPFSSPMTQNPPALGMDPLLLEAEGPGKWLLQSMIAFSHLQAQGWSLEQILQVTTSFPQTGASMFELLRRQFLQQVGALFLWGGTLPPLSHTDPGAEEGAQMAEALRTGLQQGWHFFYAGQAGQALAMGQISMVLLRHVHSWFSPTERALLFAGTYNLLGSAWCLHGRYHEAFQAHQSASLAALEAGDLLTLCYSRLGQVNALYGQGEYQQAILSAQQLLRLFDQLPGSPPPTLRAHLLGLWAESALALEDYRLASQLLDRIGLCLEQEEITPNESFDRANWYHLSGKLAILTGDFPRALQHGKQALQALSIPSVLRQLFVLLPFLTACCCLRERDEGLRGLELVQTLLPTTYLPSFARPLQDVLGGFLTAFPHEKPVSDLVNTILPSLTSPAAS